MTDAYQPQRKLSHPQQASVPAPPSSPNPARRIVTVFAQGRRLGARLATSPRCGQTREGRSAQLEIVVRPACPTVPAASASTAKAAEDVIRAVTRNQGASERSLGRCSARHQPSAGGSSLRPIVFWRTEVAVGSVRFGYRYLPNSPVLRHEDSGDSAIPMYPSCGTC
jgi:hypothetical protein